MIISGQTPLFRIRQEIYSAEDNVYAIFNELVDDRRYEITCSMEAATGTRIKRRLCLPEYHREATRQQARNMMDGLPVMPIEGTLEMQHAILKERMEAIAEDSPEFREALIYYVNLKTAFTDKRNGVLP